MWSIQGKLKRYIDIIPFFSTLINTGTAPILATQTGGSRVKNTLSASACALFIITSEY